MESRSAPERYFYPAVFTYYGPGKEIAVDFPDLEVATSGTDDTDALLSARELLGITMLGIERDGEAVPRSTPLPEVHLEENETVALIDVYMPALRKIHDHTAVDRMVTLPAWLNAAASERNVDLSQVLLDALKEIVRPG